MKTLIINGSPRKHGDSKHIIEKMREKLDGEVHVINVYKENFSACIDCRHSWTSCECRLEDEFQKTYQMIETFDSIILSSPIYFSELSGPLLSYASRFQRYYAEKYLMKNHNFKMKEKKGAIILTAGGDCRTIKRPIETAEIIFNHLNVKLVGVVKSMNTNEVPANADKDIEKQIAIVAKVLNIN